MFIKPQFLLFLITIKDKQKENGKQLKSDIISSPKVSHPAHPSSNSAI